MSQKMIYEHFCVLMPAFSYSVDTWFPNGPGSIRIRLIDKEEFIFTYKSLTEWQFETLKNYMNKLKEAKKRYVESQRD